MPSKKLLHAYLASCGEESLPGLAYKLGCGKLIALDEVGPISVTAVDAGRMCITSVVSTESEDRSRDIVRTAGIKLTNHKANPIVLWGHDQDSPIGKAEDPDGKYTVVKEPGRLVATTYFSQKSKLAAEVFALYAEKILRGWSIGFMPMQLALRAEDGKDENFRPKGFDLSVIELAEYSAVAVPDNQDSLTLSLDNGKITEPILVKSLSRYKLLSKSTVLVPDLAGIIMPTDATLTLTDEQQKLFDESVAKAVQKELAKKAEEEAGDRLDESDVEKPADETETKDGMDSDDVPDGAMALTDIHDQLIALCEHIASIAGKQDNVEVIKTMDESLQRFEQYVGDIAAKFAETYPDLPVLQDVPVEGEEEVAEEKSARARLLKRLEKLKVIKKAAPAPAPVTDERLKKLTQDADSKYAALEAKFLKLVADFKSRVARMKLADRANKVWG